MEPVTSTQNQGIKDTIKLSKSRERKKTGLFVIEGEREIRRAYENQYSFRKLYYCKKHLTKSALELLNNINCEYKAEVSEHVFSRIAYRDNSDGLVAIALTKKHSLNNLGKIDNPIYLVVESVEKPGNLGALLRTADAAGIDGVIVCDNNTELYNPNVIRSSLGCLFTKPVAICDSEACIAFLREREVKIYAAALQNSSPYTKADMRQPSAIVMGSEAFGLSEIWRKAADKIIAIPMKGIVDSLNVSVSAAVLIYEAIRQRD